MSEFTWSPASISGLSAASLPHPSGLLRLTQPSTFRREHQNQVCLSCVVSGCKLVAVPHPNLPRDLGLQYCSVPGVGDQFQLGTELWQTHTLGHPCPRYQPGLLLMPRVKDEELEFSVCSKLGALG